MEEANSSNHPVAIVKEEVVSFLIYAQNAQTNCFANFSNLCEDEYEQGGTKGGTGSGYNAAVSASDLKDNFAYYNKAKA